MSKQIPPQLREFDLVKQIFPQIDNLKPRKTKRGANSPNKMADNKANASKHKEARIVSIVKKPSNEGKPEAKEDVNKPSNAGKLAATKQNKQAPGTSDTVTNAPSGQQGGGGVKSIVTLTQFSTMMGDMQKELLKSQASAQQELQKEMMSTLSESIIEGMKAGFRGPPQEEDEEDNSSETPTNAGDDDAAALLKQIDDVLADTPEGAKDATKDDSPSDEVLANYAKDLAIVDPLGPAINAQLCPILDGMLLTRLKDDKIKAKAEIYDRPENCPTIIVTRVNPEIWSKLKGETRSQDIKLQKIQQRMVKGFTALAYLADSMLEAKKGSKELDLEKAIRLLLDGYALFANANQELNQRRRDLIKPDLNDKFAQLCSLEKPGTTLLFGTDLPQAIKDINETNKVGYEIANKSGYKPYSRGGYNPYNRGGYNKSYTQRGPKNWQGNRGYNPRYQSGGFQNRNNNNNKNNYRNNKNSKNNNNRK